MTAIRKFDPLIHEFENDRAEEKYTRWLTEKNAIGRNLNQITRAINSGEFKIDLNHEYLRDLITACGRHRTFFQNFVNK